MYPKYHKHANAALYSLLIQGAVNFSGVVNSQLPQESEHASIYDVIPQPPRFQTPSHALLRDAFLNAIWCSNMCIDAVAQAGAGLPTRSC